jgi:hypothetical protein
LGDGSSPAAPLPAPGAAPKPSGVVLCAHTAAHRKVRRGGEGAGAAGARRERPRAYAGAGKGGAGGGASPAGSELLYGGLPDGLIFEVIDAKVRPKRIAPKGAPSPSPSPHRPPPSAARGPASAHRRAAARRRAPAGQGSLRPALDPALPARRRSPREKPALRRWCRAARWRRRAHRRAAGGGTTWVREGRGWGEWLKEKMRTHRSCWLTSARSSTWGRACCTTVRRPLPERERERDTDRDRQRQRDRETERQRQRQRQRQRERREGGPCRRRLRAQCALRACREAPRARAGASPVLEGAGGAADVSGPAREVSSLQDAGGRSRTGSLRSGTVPDATLDTTSSTSVRLSPVLSFEPFIAAAPCLLSRLAPLCPVF